MNSIYNQHGILPECWNYRDSLHRFLASKLNLSRYPNYENMNKIPGVEKLSVNIFCKTWFLRSNISI
jgi:hypothetical protein